MKKIYNKKKRYNNVMVAKLSEYHKGVIWVLISASSFGFLVIVTKFTYREDINAITLLFLRFLFALIILFGYTQFENLDLKLKKKDLVAVLALGGIFFFVATFGFYHSLYYLPAGTAVLMSYTYPVFVTLIAFCFLNERITTKVIIALLLALIGVFLIVYSKKIEVNLKGVVLITISSFFNSIYLTLGKITVKNIDPRVMSFYIIFSVTFVYFITGTSTGLLQIYLTLKGTLLILLMGLVSAAIPVTFFKGLKLIGASTASILNTFGCVITIALGFLLLGEIISSIQLVGGMLIIISVLILRKKNQ